MDAAQALSELTEISSQIEAAVVLDGDGSVLASTLDEERAGELARNAQELVAAAGRAAARDDKELVQVEIATPDGSVFIVRDGERTIAATTGSEPTVGLVFYDLKSCLRTFSEEAPKPGPPKPRPRRRKAESDAAA